MSHNFVHFRALSSYSMLESALKIDQLVNLAKKNQMDAICLTDRGNLFGSLEFAIEASQNKIQPIHGILLNIIYKNNNKDDFAEILLIAKDEVGYKNLLKLAGLIYTKNNRSICEHINFNDLLEYNEGLIILSAYDKGVIGKLLLNKSYNAAFNAAKQFKEHFGNRFYFEIMRHGYENEKSIEDDYLKIANELSIPLIATNNILFGDGDMHEAHDILLCISNSTTLEDQTRKRVSTQCYFKSYEEMRALFDDIPEAIENCGNLAKRCSYMSEIRAPSLPNFSNGSISEEELLRKLSQEGLKKRLLKDNIIDQTEYYSRLEYELGIISSMKYSGYFLIVSDFIKWSKNNNIAVGPGRGSGAGSIIAWSLEITDPDPIKFGLLFERFLNPERISMPDFDIDFCQERREEVINYVRNKYGDERVGQIITFGKMQAKAVIKDVSRVMGLKYAIADYLTELVPFNAINPVTLSQAIEDVKELNQAFKGKGLYNFEGEEELIRQVLEVSLTLEGLHRHASTHAAGIVIANENLNELVPVYKDQNSEMLIVQYSMKYSEAAGLVKFDFLGLQTLTVITKTLELLAKENINLDITALDLNNSKTFEILSKGLTTGVFQFESVGMKSAIRKLMPDNLDDIIALGALYRPGPMDNIPTFIACKHGMQAVDFLHPMLTNILSSTYGVIVYQEQVMEIAKVLAGYNLGAADLLRRAMGKKVKAEMDAQEEIFVSGAVKNNVKAEHAKSIFATVSKFAGYGFNKSHATAYGLISYQTAYLKANYPAEFFIACLNLDILNSDKVNIYLQDTKNFGIKILPPSINLSNGQFSIIYLEQKKHIIFALGAIKGVSKNFGNIVSEIREKYGEFKSIIDFIEKIDPKLLNKKTLENLIKSGCFDDLHPNRNSLLVNLNNLIAYNNSYHIEKFSSQFSLISVQTNSNDILKTHCEPLENSELAYLEFDVLGLFIKNHPLDNIQSLFEKINVKSSKFINEELQEGNSSIKLAGIITRKDSRMSSRGRFITLTIADQLGDFEVTIFDENTLQTYANYLVIKKSVIVYCEASKDKGGLRLVATKFSEIDNELADINYNLILRLNNSDQLADIMDYLKNKEIEGDKTSSIRLELGLMDDYVTKINLSTKFNLNDYDIKNLEKLCCEVVNIL